MPLRSTLFDTILRPQSAQCRMPPESSQKRSPALELRRLTSIAALAASTHSTGLYEHDDSHHSPFDTTQRSVTA